MARKLASDKVLFGALVALSLFGCVMIYSASAVSAGETSGNPYRYLVKQIAALASAGSPRSSIYRTDYRQLRAALGRLRRLRRRAGPGRLRALPAPDQRRAPLDPARRDHAAAGRAPEGRPRARCSRTSSRARARRRRSRSGRSLPGGRLFGRRRRRRGAAAGPRHGGLLRDALRRAAVARGRARAVLSLRSAGDRSPSSPPCCSRRTTAGRGCSRSCTPRRIRWARASRRSSR